jgi:hypothetical protein
MSESSIFIDSPKSIDPLSNSEVIQPVINDIHLNLTPFPKTNFIIPPLSELIVEDNDLITPVKSEYCVVAGCNPLYLPGGVIALHNIINQRLEDSFDIWIIYSHPIIVEELSKLSDEKHFIRFIPIEHFKQWLSLLTTVRKSTQYHAFDGKLDKRFYFIKTVYPWIFNQYKWVVSIDMNKLYLDVLDFKHPPPKDCHILANWSFRSDIPQPSSHEEIVICNEFERYEKCEDKEKFMRNPIQGLFVIFNNELIHKDKLINQILFIDRRDALFNQIDIQFSDEEFIGRLYPIKAYQIIRVVQHVNRGHLGSILRHAKFCPLFYEYASKTDILEQIMRMMPKILKIDKEYEAGKLIHI